MLQQVVEKQHGSNKRIQEYLKNIYIITFYVLHFTNRAALELGQGIDNNRVYFGTIHNFINHLISSFFK